MQNRYVADVGDFGKFGLLRALAGVTGSDDGPRLSIGVVWYRPSKETGPPGDGKKRDYLDSSRQQRFEECDPELFGHLKEISDANRDLNEIGDRGILGGEPGDLYNCAIEVPERHVGTAISVETREPISGSRRWTRSATGRSSFLTPTTA